MGLLQFKTLGSRAVAKIFDIYYYDFFNASGKIIFSRIYFTIKGERHDGMNFWRKKYRRIDNPSRSCIMNFWHFFPNSKSFFISKLHSTLKQTWRLLQDSMWEREEVLEIFFFFINSNKSNKFATSSTGCKRNFLQITTVIFYPLLAGFNDGNVINCDL